MTNTEGIIVTTGPVDQSEWVWQDADTSAVYHLRDERSYTHVRATYRVDGNGRVHSWGPEGWRYVATHTGPVDSSTGPDIARDAHLLIRG
jgi:hypothetical protein